MSENAALPKAFWAEIRRHWECDPDAPSYVEAARRASESFGLAPPGKTGVDARCKHEGWVRIATGPAASRSIDEKASALAKAVVEHEESGVPMTPEQRLDFEAAVRVGQRAEVLARHRGEFGPVRAILGEAEKVVLTFDGAALARKGLGPDEVADARKAAHDSALRLAKLGKMLADARTAVQASERLAWGLGGVVDAAWLESLGDDELQAFHAGKRVRGRQLDWREAKDVQGR